MMMNYKKHGRVDDMDRYIGSKVKLRRLLLGLNQEVIGKALGVSIQQIQKYERGINRISCSSLYRIGKVLDTPITYFFDDIEDSILDSRYVSTSEDIRHLATNEKEIFLLMKAYNGIQCTQTRKVIVELMAIL